MRSITRPAGDFGLTVKILGRVFLDWLTLRARLEFPRRAHSFAFLVHPRTVKLTGRDVYGHHDIFRALPFFRYLFKILPERYAGQAVMRFVMAIPPSTLSHITVRGASYSANGYLLTTPRTPDILYGEQGKTRRHLGELFELASRKGVTRVGLGALLPSLTRGGQAFAQSDKRPAISTGHAYTAYSIAQYLRLLVSHRNKDGSIVGAAIVGAAGSTGKAVMRTLAHIWSAWQMRPIDLVLIDIKEGRLQAVAQEARQCQAFRTVHASSSLYDLRDRDVQYAIVVTNDAKTIIHPEHARPGTIFIDDSQPRNTSPALVSSGCIVLDVLARINGLDCRFDFGFKTRDRSVTFTCLAETALAAALGYEEDLAVGEVTDEVIKRTLDLIRQGEALKLFGPLPIFSFGRELSAEQQHALLHPASVETLAARAE